jgi:DNA-directed RNA polymerase beta' subunit
VDKVPVIPVAYREAHDRGFKIEEDEIDRLYKNLLSLAKSNRSEFTSQWMEAFKDFNAKETVQAALNRLYKYFIGKLEKKTGFFRSALIGKRLDNVARLVANARPDIPIDSCIIPWHVLLNIFDIYIAAYCQQPEHEDIAKKLSLYNKSSQEIGDHLDYIFRNVSVYVKDYPENQVLFIQMLTDIFNKYPDLRVLVKRDPGWNADSFWCFKPLINTELSYQIWVPAFVYSPLGGDSFNTNFFITTAINNVLFEDDKFIVKKTNDESSFIVKTLNSVWKKQNFQNLN